MDTFVTMTEIGLSALRLKSYRSYSQLLEASDAAFEIAKPGATASDLFNAMNSI